MLCITHRHKGVAPLIQPQSHTILYLILPDPDPPVPAQLLQLHPDPNSQASKELLPMLMSDLWHQMTPDQRQPFLDMAAKDRERFEKDVRDYRRRMAEAGIGGFEDGEGGDMPGMMRGMGGGSGMHMGTPQSMAHMPQQGFFPMSPSSAFPGGDRLQQQQLRIGIPVNVSSAMHAMQGGMQSPPLLIAGSGPGGGGAMQLLTGGQRPMVMGMPMLPPDMDHEELDHLCHFPRTHQPGLISGQQGGEQGHHLGQHPEPLDHGLGLDEHGEADFELAMSTLRGQDAAAAAGIDLFGCSAQVQLTTTTASVGDGGSSGAKAAAAAAGGTAGGSQQPPVAVGAAMPSAVAAFGALKGGRVSGQDQPHASSSAGSPSDVHVSHAAFQLGGLQAYPGRNNRSSGGGGYAALYPGSPYDYALTLSDDPVGQHQLAFT